MAHFHVPPESFDFMNSVRFLHVQLEPLIGTSTFRMEHFLIADLPIYGIFWPI